jgi:hypothetical protein
MASGVSFGVNAKPLAGLEPMSQKRDMGHPKHLTVVGQFELRATEVTENTGGLNRSVQHHLI